MIKTVFDPRVQPRAEGLASSNGHEHSQGGQNQTRDSFSANPLNQKAQQASMPDNPRWWIPDPARSTSRKGRSGTGSGVD